MKSLLETWLAPRKQVERSQRQLQLKRLSSLRLFKARLVPGPEV